jgi:phage terminase large subunit-like protein
MNRLYQYTDQVLNGKIVTGELMQLAVKRFIADRDRSWDFVFDEKKAGKAIRFFENLNHWKGEWAGTKIRLEPHQCFYIGQLFGWVNKDTGLRRFRTSFKEVARKNAKALSIETPILTPSGFKKMGEIQVGDIVYDENGKQCNVILATDTMYGHDCYKVLFNDGTEIICDADHLWTVVRKEHSRYSRVTIDTKSLHKDLFNKDGERINKIPVCKPVQNEKKELPIDPYVLGVWLGDGVSANGCVVCQDSDDEVIREIERRGYVSHKKTHKDRTPVYRIGVSVMGDHRQTPKGKSLQRELKDIGLLNNKYIPELYFNSSIEQRTELLWGLMDTDGTISKAGQCSYSASKERLSLDVSRLIVSLGFKCTTEKQYTSLNGKLFPSYRITFFAYSNRPVFHLQRKIDRQKLKPIRPTRNAWRHIVNIDLCYSVPVKCIKVDSESHLYLASESLIPTHNTTECAGKSIYHLVYDNEPGAQVYFTATKEDQARIGFKDCQEIIKATPGLRSMMKTMTKSVIYESNFIKPLGSDSNTQDGFDPSWGVIDEYHAHKTDEMLNVLESGMGARRQPMIDVITTAGFHKDYPCYAALRKTGIEILKGIKQDESYLVMIYELDEKDDWHDQTTWIKSNPNLNVSVKLEYLQNRFLKAMNEGGTKEVDFRTKNLNQWTDSAETWIEDAVFMNCSDPLPDLSGRECYLGQDLASTEDMNSHALFFPGDPCYAILRYYVPRETMKKRVKDGADHLRWEQQGWLNVTPGNVTDYDFLIADAIALKDKYKIKKLGYDPWNAKQTAVKLQDLGFVVEEVRQGVGSMGEATKKLETLIRDKRLIHGGNPILRWNNSNIVIIKDSNGNIKMDKGHSTGKIDGMVALTNAIVVWLRDNEKVIQPNIRLL